MPGERNEVRVLFTVAAVIGTQAPIPSPEDLPPAELVTPGPWGFLAIALIALAVILLIWDMMRRIRRGRYRAEIREELDAEQAAAEQAHEASLDSSVDDQDIDGDSPAKPVA